MCMGSKAAPAPAPPPPAPPPPAPAPMLTQVVPERAKDNDDTTAAKQKKKAQGTKKYQTPLNIAKNTSGADGGGINTAN